MGGAAPFSLGPDAAPVQGTEGCKCLRNVPKAHNAGPSKEAAEASLMRGVRSVGAGLSA